MMSTGSLHSSSTLLASSRTLDSPNNSICEVTDIDTDCPSEVEQPTSCDGDNSEGLAMCLYPNYFKAIFILKMKIQ